MVAFDGLIRRRRRILLRSIQLVVVEWLESRLARKHRALHRTPLRLAKNRPTPVLGGNSSKHFKPSHRRQARFLFEDGTAHMIDPPPLSLNSRLHALRRNMLTIRRLGVLASIDLA